MMNNDDNILQPFLGMAASLVYILAIDWNPLTSPDRRRFPEIKKSNMIDIVRGIKVNPIKSKKESKPESQLSGLSGSGWAIKAIIALHTDWSVHAGLQAFFRISRQISPV